jgi:asparagine synthase (glutamine-hydrolysing)
VSVVIAAAATTELDPLTSEWVLAATAHARFAGPDGEGTRFGQRWGLGHALLRLAHERSSQPIALADGFSLSADVRLDDRGAIRAALASSRRPATVDDDDSQLVAQGYAAWGERVLERIAGDFAFALWDEHQQRLVCACDQIGVVPLHYAEVGDQLLVASSPELLLLHPEVSATLEHGAVADFLLTGHLGSFGITTFAAIRRIPPAHVLTWSAGQLTVRRYWQPPDLEPLLRLSTPQEYVEDFRELLERVVCDRIDSGSLTSHLSGGMDSTSVTALAHRVRTRRGDGGELRGITVVQGESTGDQEGRYAALVAESLGIETDLVDESRVGTTDPLAPPKLLTPEPTAYPWSNVDVQRLAIPAARSRTCLTGLGADPVLGFLPWYWAEWIARGELRRLATVSWDQARMFGERPKPHLRTALRHLAVSRRTPVPEAPAWMNAVFATEVDVPTRLRSHMVQPGWLQDRRSLTGHAAWQCWFTWGDPTYTRFPLRFRHPMADIRLLAFVARIAPYPWLVRKQILRAATSDLLPAAVLQRPKTLLVDTPRLSATPEARTALAELITSTPAADQFLDRSALREAVLNASSAPWHDWLLTRPLGLVYWLANWERPVSRTM